MTQSSNKLCAICQEVYYPRRPYEWFCNTCYTTWGDEIRDKKAWVRFCVSSELNRRRQEFRNSRLVLLGDDWDVVNDGALIRRYD